MDSFSSSSRDWSQIDRGISRLSSPSPVSVDDEDLFLQVFDWNSYCQSTTSFEVPPRDLSASPAASSPSLSYSRATPQDLSQLITEIPTVIDNLSLGNFESDFFGMAAPFRSDDDVSSVSDDSARTPPELVHAGSSSPSDHTGSVILDQADYEYHSPHVTLHEVQAQDDEWTYPQTEVSKGRPRGYPSHIQVVSDERYRGNSSDQSVGSKRRRSEHASVKRHRRLSDPMQTADVRKTGACLPCRLTKTRCHDSGVCPTCRKSFPEHSHLACTRITPAMAWPVISRVPDVWSSAAEDEELLCSGPRFYTGKPREISVFFTKDTNSSALRATVQAYRSREGSEDSPKKANFPRDCVPSHQTLQKWAEEQIRREHQYDFERGVESFLLAYSEDGKGLPKHGLVNKVHKMNCFFKIWQTDSFWCRDPANNIVNLPLSVQAQLRNIARKGLDSLEHDIFKELDDCLTQQGPSKSQELLAIWACMWQLILMYRGLLDSFNAHIMRHSHYMTMDDQTLTAQTHLYNALRDGFFPLLTVFYHYHFRTKKSIELSIDWIKSTSYPHTARNSKAIHYFAEQLFECRKGYYQTLQNSENHTDQLLCVFIVDHELKKLSARKRKPASSSKSKTKSAITDNCYANHV